MSPQEQVLYEFEGYVLDPVRRLLTRSGEPVPLPPKALATLLVLVERHGQVVDKEEILQKVWPDTFITEATLTQNVFRLRKTLGEEAGEHRFIVTVPGRGYSFVADLRHSAPSSFTPVSAEAPPPAAPPVPPEAPVPSLGEDTGISVPVSEPAPIESGHSGSKVPRWIALGGSALLLIAVGAVSLSVMRSRRSDPPRPPGALQETARAPRRSIAVLGFRNLSGRDESAWLSTALAEMFTGELGVGERLHTITGESVTQTKRDLRLGDPQNLSRDTLSRLHDRLACDVVLLGSYLALGQEGGGRIRVDLKLQDTATGETLSVLTGTRDEGDLFELVSDLGRDLRVKLGTGPATHTEVASTRAAFPAGREAGRLYSQGLEHLRALDTLAARDLLERATEAEPTFPLAHAALASAWSTLGYDANAEQEAARALALSAGLPREDRLLVEAAHAETRRDWAKAVDIYDSLWRFFPDNLEHGLHLADAEVAAGRARRALVTIASLRRLPEPLADDPRIDLAEAEAAAALSDFASQERAALHAAEKGRKLKARLLTAQALHLQGLALRSQGRQEEALARIHEAESIFSAAGDQVGVASAIHDIANLLRDSGDFEGARQQYQRALDIHREAGNQRGIVLALTNLGGLEIQAGNYDKAQGLLQEVVKISQEVHDPLGEARALTSLGSAYQEQGDLQAAQRSLEEALRRFRSIGHILGEAGARTSLSAVYLDLGRLREARAEAENGIRLSRQIGHPRSLGLALRKLGLVLVEEGQLKEAQAAYREMDELAGRTGHKLLLADAKAGTAEIQRLQGKLAEAQQNAKIALDLWTETAERQQTAEGQLALARIALNAGRVEAAEQQAREALDRFRALRLADGEALGHEALAEIFLARGQAGAANDEIGSALKLTAPSQNRRVRLAVTISAGRTAGAQGRTAEARRTLAAARDEGALLGLRMSALDAALALAELELLQGDPVAGEQSLKSLHEEASRRGYELAAGRAFRLLQAAEVARR